MANLKIQPEQVAMQECNAEKNGGYENIDPRVHEGNWIIPKEITEACLGD